MSELAERAARRGLAVENGTADRLSAPPLKVPPAERADGVLVADRACRLLREDAELAEAIPQPRRTQAIERCTAVELKIPAGRWDGEAPVRVGGAGVGLLVLGGIAACRVSIGDRAGTELLGTGDLIGCSPADGDSAMLPVLTGCTALARLRVAVLDGGFVERELARYPELAAALVARATARSRRLAVSLAIVNRPRVDARLYLLFCHLAGRWGRVRRDEVLLPVRLTHSLLAELVAARRPTVTSALSSLAVRGLVVSRSDGWALPRAAAGDLLDLGVLHTRNGASYAHPSPDS